MKNYFFVVNTRANGIMLVSVTALYCTFHQNLLGNKIIAIKWNSRSWKELIIFTSSANPKYSNNTHMQTQISFHPKVYIKKVIRAASCLFSIWKLRFSEKKKKWPQNFNCYRQFYPNLREIDDHSHYNLVYIKKHPYSELFWSAFPAFAYSLPLGIQSKCGKMRTRITPNKDTFCAVMQVVSTSFYVFYVTVFETRNFSYFLKFFLDNYGGH